MESGLDEALRLMNKGYTTAEAEHERIRLKAAGIDYGANIIFGSAGPELRMENALKTAELINKTKPYLFLPVRSMQIPAVPCMIGCSLENSGKVRLGSTWKRKKRS